MDWKIPLGGNVSRILYFLICKYLLKGFQYVDRHPVLSHPAASFGAPQLVKH